MKLHIIKLEKERKRLKLNRSAFSRYLGMETSTYHKMVESKTTTIARINQMAEKLEIDPKDLLTD